jgi:hypothetical protein
MPLTVKHSIRTLSLAGLLVLLAACSGAGAASPAASLGAASVAPGESAPSLAPLPPSASSSGPPEASAGPVSITTAEGAVAAVVAQQPQFAGYEMVAPLIGASASPVSHIGPIGGTERSVLVEQIAAGFRVIFVTGSGDCPAGCIDHRYDVFVVDTDGTVVPACVLDRFPVGRADPCAGA